MLSLKGENMEFTGLEIIELIQNGNQNLICKSLSDKYIPPSKRYKSFKATYKPFAKFTVSRKCAEYYEKCLEAVKDEKLLGQIIFCNDYHHIPPAISFIRFYNKELPGKDENFNIDDYVKKSIGAFWGFVFKSIMGYTIQKSGRVNNCFGIKTATFYSKE